MAETKPKPKQEKKPRNSKPKPKPKTTRKPKSKMTQGGGKSTMTRSDQRPSPPRQSRRSPSSPPPHNIVAVYNHIAPIANNRFSSSPESRSMYIRTAIAQEMLRSGFPRANFREESARRSRAIQSAHQYLQYLERTPNPRHGRISSPGGSPRSRRSSPQQGGKTSPDSSRTSTYM